MSIDYGTPASPASPFEYLVDEHASAERPAVLVVDDDVGIGAAMRRLFTAVGLRCEVFASADELLGAPTQAGPACLVMDVRLADVNGIELYDRLRSTGRELPAVFITGFGDLRSGVRAMKAGAVDFLEKPVDAEVLLTAVGRALERDAAAAPARAQRAQLEHRVSTLTPSELEVLQLLVAGLPTKQIAAALGTKERTVKTRRGSVRKKLQASSLADVVRMGIALGLPGSERQGAPSK